MCVYYDLQIQMYGPTYSQYTNHNLLQSVLMTFPFRIENRHYVC